MLRQVARKTHQRVGDQRQPSHQRRLRIEARFAKARTKILAVVPPGDAARQALDLVGLQAKRLTGVAQRAFRAVTDHRRRQRGALAAVFFIDVLDHLFAPLMLEINIDVRRLVALPGDETLEQHGHARRIDRGDAQRVADRRVGGRTAALAQDARAPGKADDVLDGEEKRLVAELGDQRQLVFDQRANLVRHALRKALF